MTTTMIPLAPAVADLLTAAAGRLALNGHHLGDFFPNALSDRATPYAERPLDVSAAIQFAATGDPRSTSKLALAALWLLADHVAEVNVQPDSVVDAYGQLAKWEEQVADRDVAATLLDLAERVLAPDVRVCHCVPLHHRVGLAARLDGWRELDDALAEADCWLVPSLRGRLEYCANPGPSAVSL